MLFRPAKIVAVEEPTPAVNPAVLSMGRAMGLMTLVSLGAKVMAFVTQWVVGAVLAPADFASYAAVLSLQSIVGATRDAGVGKYLVQTGSYTTRAYVAALIAVIGALALAALLGTASFALRAPMGQMELPMLVLPIAMGLPLQAMSSVLAAKLRLDGAYSSLARAESGSALVQAVVTISLVLAGAGAQGLVVGLGAQVLAMFCLARAAVQGGVPYQPFTPTMIREIVGATKWIVLAGIAIAMVLRGDALVLSFHESKTKVGFYFFGVQLVVAATAVLSSSLQTVLLPEFARSLVGTEGGLQRVYTEAQRRILQLSVPLTVLGVTAAPHLIHVLWKGRWDDAAIVVQGALAAFGIKVHSSVAGVALEAAGRWRLRVTTLTAEAIFLMIGSAVMFFDGSLRSLVISTTVARISASSIVLLTSTRELGLSHHSLLPLTREWVPYVVFALVMLVVENVIKPEGTKEHFLFAVTFGLVGAMIFIVGYKNKVVGNYTKRL